MRNIDIWYQPQVLIDNQQVFRKILSYYDINHDNLTIDQIYEKYSSGDRTNKTTITNFKIKDDIYYISYCRIGKSGGYSQIDKFKYENNNLTYLGVYLIMHEDYF